MRNVAFKHEISILKKEELLICVFTMNARWTCVFLLISLEITAILRLNRVYDSVWSFGKKRILLKYVKLIDKPHQHY
jgi:hypothetical protein